MTGVPLKEDVHGETREKLRADRDGEWSDAATSPGTQGLPAAEAGTGWKDPPGASGRAQPTDPLFQTCRLQAYEKKWVPVAVKTP